MIPPEEVRVLDINASFLGVRTVTLMENAGRAVAKHVLEEYPKVSRIAVVCGKGNNGGDGFVAARYIAGTKPVDVYLVEPPAEISSDLARANFEMVKGSARMLDTIDVRQYDLIVDAMLGVGLSGRPKEPYADAIRLLNSSRKIIVSVDVPTGWPSDLQVKPDETVTFHAPKVGMNKNNSGRIVVVDIGIPKEAEEYCGPGEFALLPPRRRDAHKGDAGRVMVIGGGPYTGAPAFSSMAAMRSGVDLAFVFTPEPAATPVSIYSPNIIVRPLEGDILTEEHVEDLVAFSKQVDVMVIGPGLGSAKETLAAIQKIILGTHTKMVIDADAIAACGAAPRILRGKSGVITPHAGEFKKLTGMTAPEDDSEKRAKLVKEASSKLGLTVLLKGAIDVISDGAYVKLNRTGNNAMTVGGTGDVLTGIVAGMLAQGATPFAAARLGAFTSGVAGDLAFEEKSYGLLATDVIDKIPIVLRRYLLSRG